VPSAPPSARRLAFLSPLPPAPTGIADYSAEVLALLATRYEVDVFHDQQSVERHRLPSSCEARHASEFPLRHRARPYDVAIYQMGNSPHHGFVYDRLARIPGLLVLHDLVLHHSRARLFLESAEALAYARDPSSASLRDAAARRIAAYREEVAYCYPRQSGRLAEVHLGTVGDLLPYAYPLFRIPVEASRLTAVHNDFMAQAVRSEVPSAAVVHVPMIASGAPAPKEAVAALRARYHIGPDELVVGSYGWLTREKRIETVARAVARAAVALPRLRLLLVGPIPDAASLWRSLDRLGVRDLAVVTGRVPFSELSAHIAAADIAVHLRYPTARETSAALLRLLAQGRPVVISDLEHLADIPADAVVRADVRDEEGEVTRAILRLAARGAAREAIGARAAEFARRQHSPARCLEAYHAAVEAAARAPDPPRRAWPAHWSG
jgi:glycosyltransferase involved in cell wall biosynthesis